jgi:succinoglycan biosynthesis transport protein ExoP
MNLPLPPSDRHDRGPHSLERGFPPPRDTDNSESLDWRRIWAAVQHWRWLVIGCVLLGAAAGLVALRFVPATYRAQATIWIDSRDWREAGGPEPLGASRLLDADAWLDLARSYAVLDDAAKQERLYLHHDRTLDPLFEGFGVDSTFRPGEYRLAMEGTDYVLRTDAGAELDRAAAGDSLGRPLGFRWTPRPGALEEGRASFEVATLRDASTQLSKQLVLHIDPEGNLLRLELEGTDPQRLTGVLDRIAERYVAIVGELKRRKVTALAGILSEQLDSASVDLVNAESTYQSFRTRTITLPSEREISGTALVPGGPGIVAPDPITIRYFTLQLTREEYERQRVALERALTSGEGGGMDIEALNGVPAARNSLTLAPALDSLAAREAQLRELRTRYSDEHPEVIQLASRVAVLRDRTIPAIAATLVKDLRDREGMARGAELALGTDLRRIPARSLEEARLRRNVTLAEELHNTVQQRREEARLAEASILPDARVLDRAAVPRAPVRDSAPRIMALAFLGSLGVGLLAAVLLDRADPRFRYPGQVSRELGLPIIGAIPHVPRPDPAAGSKGALTDGMSSLVEALRGVRMSILNSAGDEPPLMLTISSPGPGDGKSFLASHLAFTFAEAGYRTLLVDGDMRRGRLHRRFGTGRRPGLCDVLQGEPVESAIRTTDYPSLSIMPCGIQSQRAPEYLTGPRMAAVMAELGRLFQVVVFDSPPLSAGIDAYVEAVATGRMVLVLRNGVSHREMMTAKLGVLGRMPIEVLGVVMNDVPAGPDYAYFSYYLPGYQAKDEDPHPAAIVR